MGRKGKNDTFWIDWWVRHRERAISNKWYAVGRMDLLVISISAGGVYVVLEVLKFLALDKKFSDVDSIVLKVAGLIFIVTIAMNFISQMFGFWANKESAKYSKSKIQQLRKELDFNESNMNISKCNMEMHDKGVTITNGISVFLMICGLLLLAIFIVQNFN